MNTKEILEKLKIEQPNAGCELNFSTPFELLVAVILSAQCTDKRVNMATEKLFKVYNTAEQFASLSLEELAPYIFSCGFYNNKGKNIIAMAKELVEKYNGEVPRDFDKLVKLAGVGRKTASVVMTVAFDEPAMPVDTHVFRVSRRLGLSKGNTPEKVEQDLCKAFDREDWNSLHHTMIFHGRYVCHSQRPECDKCLVKEYCIYEKDKK
ncbi:MAG: endonuclease III [Clostridia bacterium]|nr:endonuclease III [Clostridia bacterium]